MSLTIPSDVLGDTCFATTRDEDNLVGFQRMLDEKRAKEVADYIDSGFGTIPSAIVLSAQDGAELKIKPGGRALQFKRNPKAFLIIDGQHRVWGYRMAKSHLRVPVIIYQDLTRTEETRLFIDINTKQRPVPNELLLDIKQMAALETNTETLLRQLFDMFQSDSKSVMIGLLSPHERAKGKLTRTTFNAAFSSVNVILERKSPEELFPIFNAYLGAYRTGFKQKKINDHFLMPNVFKAIVAFFPEVASKVKDRFDGSYSVDHFSEVLEPVFDKLTKNKITQVGRSYKALHEHFLASLNRGFSL